MQDLAESDALTRFLKKWQDTPSRIRDAFLRLKHRLETRRPATLEFRSRPGVSHSLRAVAGGESLFALLDVIDDDPANRWLSVCFYSHAVTDPMGLGNRIPGGLLGQDGYCFDLLEWDETALLYLEERIDEAHANMCRTAD